MLEAMSIVAAVAMVVLLLRIRRHRNVAHQMWVKMVGMEFEIDRMRDLLRHSCVQIGCACEFHPEGYMAKGAEYVDQVTESMIHNLGHQDCTGTHLLHEAVGAARLGEEQVVPMGE